MGEYTVGHKVGLDNRVTVGRGVKNKNRGIDGAYWVKWKLQGIDRMRPCTDKTGALQTC